MDVHESRVREFFAEVQREGAMFGIRDREGHFPLTTPEGQRIMPFWSRRSRAFSFVNTSRTYADYDVATVTMRDWRWRRWGRGLRRAGVMIRLNWEAEHAVGHDITADELAAGFARLLEGTRSH